MYHKSILEELLQIKQLLTQLEKNSAVLGDWIPKKSVQKFFDYSNTQMRVIEKQHKLQVSKIKARSFYSVESVLNLLESHKIK